VTRTATLILASLLLAVVAAPVKAYDHRGDDEPNVDYVQAFDLGSTAATLRASIDAPRYPRTTYRFDYGVNPTFSSSTPTASVEGDNAVVTARITGLRPNTRYALRVVAFNDDGSASATATFTTLIAGSAPAPSPPSDGDTGDPDDPSDRTGDEPGDEDDGSGDSPTGEAAPEPELGRSVVTMPASGVVRVRTPGTRTYHELGGAEDVPVGSIIDTTRGSVQLSTALDSQGDTQTGTFSGGTFQVRQSRTGGGMTDIVLRGGRFGACATRARARGAIAVASARGKRVRRLWAKDKGGRFRTHGRNSVATVRGTRWLTEDRCDGTLTVVRSGSVVVRERRGGRQVVVRAGGRHLARRTG
jgi:hypothetical protein